MQFGNSNIDFLLPSPATLDWYLNSLDGAFVNSELISCYFSWHDSAELRRGMDGELVLKSVVKIAPNIKMKSLVYLTAFVKDHLLYFILISNLFTQQLFFPKAHQACIKSLKQKQGRDKYCLVEYARCWYFCREEGHSGSFRCKYTGAFKLS